VLWYSCFRDVIFSPEAKFFYDCWLGYGDRVIVVELNVILDFVGSKFLTANLLEEHIFFCIYAN